MTATDACVVSSTNEQEVNNNNSNCGMASPEICKLNGISKPIAINGFKQRLRTGSLSRSSVPEVENVVRGYAHLCFSEDGVWFEGHLDSDDQCQYSVTGNATKMCNTVNDDNTQRLYDVTVMDHDDGETYQVGKIQRTTPIDIPVKRPETTYDGFPSPSMSSPKLNLTGTGLTFMADKQYKGQRADMLIQRHLTPRLVGQNLHVYSGRMTVEMASKDIPRPERSLWCL